MTADTFPTEWTPEVARSLAQPFASEQVGKLPRGGDNVGRDQWKFCNDCKQKAAPRHFHVDYINHAVVTDRLNSAVGPNGWSWSLLTVERDQAGRLLAVVGEMAVLGHTKGPETGAPAPTQKDYGDQLKSAISDYICRAAMRFGVALDLWAKQQLESAAAEEHKPTAAAKESEPGGASALKTRALDSAVADAAKAPDPSQGPVAAGTPPDFDHLATVEEIREWLKDHRELWPLIREDAAASGLDLQNAPVATLRELVVAAWRVRQEEAA